MFPKSDLNLRFPERRQRRRWFTLKNFRNVSLVLLVLFIGVTIRSEFGGTDDDSSFGRLVDRQMPAVEQKPLQVVQEAPPEVGDATHADPMLLAPMAREQWLHGTDTTAPAVEVQPMARAEAAVVSGETRVAVVGGPDGVAVVKQQRREPVLAGGFGRQ